MAAAYLGTVTVGGSVPGLSASFAALKGALVALSSTVSVETTAILTAEVAVDDALAALGIAKSAARLAAVASLQAQLDGAVKANLDLTAALSDPTAFAAELSAGLAQLTTNFQLFVGLPAISGQIAANVKVQAGLSAEIATIDEAFGAMSPFAAIDQSLALQLTAFSSIRAAFGTAFTAAVAASAAAASMTVSLAAPGVHVLLYTGPLSGLGAAVDASLAGGAAGGMGGGVNIRVPIVLVEESNTAGVAGVDAVFKTS